ncbi:radical SAM protein [Chitinivibrio alkaliphilus]|uniref:Pyruvate formate lyase activating enzyme n=1 Tax=Chitinivibrio alkaliphilus ACht1 TaxID=1313304 RepID=U7D7A6_9BACT|nr:radical SAM protein [Chitinivibrio alkaliphilus]ERP30977.1 pyruvate formate lyase activating enzyme [Chitinivibrio alkaliphilus ACht1]
MDEIKAYRPFYDSSGGGITVSGGEPLCQASAVAELFRLCKKEGIHTVIDTSGAVKLTHSVKTVLQYSNLVILDVKHIRSAAHHAITGMGNEKTLAFARYLEEVGIPFWVRYVVVPGYSDAEEDAVLLADFLAPFTSLEQVYLLPYHSLGEHKWKSMGVTSPLHGVAPPSQDCMGRLKECMISRGISSVSCKT